MWQRVRDSPLARGLFIQLLLLIRPRRVQVHGVTVAIDRRWPRTVLNTLYDGRYEQFEASVLRATLRSGDRYVEIGAGIGVTTTIACQIVGAASVAVFEADPEMARAAARTAALNGYAPRIVNAVLTNDEQSEQRFYVREDFWSSSVLPAPDAREVLVPARPFRAELEAVGATYLAVDIEGGEAALFDVPLPGCVRAVCVEVHPDRIGDDAVQDVLVGLIEQGFVLDTRLLGRQVLFFRR